MDTQFYARFHQFNTTPLPLPWNITDNTLGISDQIIPNFLANFIKFLPATPHPLLHATRVSPQSRDVARRYAATKSAKDWEPWKTWIRNKYLIDNLEADAIVEELRGRGFEIT